MKISARWWIGGAVFFLAAIQLVPVERSNPPAEVEITASPEVLSILRRACYDCHSLETKWPWYSRIAPVSWLVARDVREGRAELNFSAWNRMSAERSAKMKRKSWEEIEEGEMPPRLYLLPHRDAALSSADRAALRTWSLAN